MVMRSSLERSGILYGKYRIWIRPSHVYRARVLTFWGALVYTKGIKVAILLLILSTVRIVVDIIVSNRVWLSWTLTLTCSQGGHRTIYQQINRNQLSQMRL